MIEHVNMFTVLICDKCGKRQSEIDQEKFFRDGWTMNRRAKKYVHLCYSCKSKRQRETTDWAINHFYYGAPFKTPLNHDISL